MFGAPYGAIPLNSALLLSSEVISSDSFAGGWRKLILSKIKIVCLSYNVTSTSHLYESMTIAYQYHPQFNDSNTFIFTCSNIRHKVCDCNKWHQEAGSREFESKRLYSTATKHQIPHELFCVFKIEIF
ncbi:unnamed protein product [Albugo candida]|uniref:Uncharacterized protein n=1 Tax=Albugo candida TaxID=65357 RepID=A0A024G3I7_9STRA|nr:unnamed protein product [Albugo candida]|eukprot:CCI41241.1 unnamed protein product [Albugo candida]